MLNLREAAARLGVSIATLRRYIKAGVVKACRYGPRTLRIPVWAIEELATADRANMEDR